MRTMRKGPPLTRAGFLKLCAGAGAGAALLAAPALGGREVSTHVESLRPAPPPGHPRNRTIGVAGWGSGLVPSELEIP